MLEKFANIISQKLHLSSDVVITENTSFRYDLRADSFELAELIIALENEYSIKIDDEDLTTFETVGDVINYIKSM